MASLFGDGKDTGNEWGRWENCIEWRDERTELFVSFIVGSCVSLIILAGGLLPSLLSSRLRSVMWSWPYSIQAMIVSGQFVTAISQLWFVVPVPFPMELWCCKVVPLFMIFSQFVVIILLSVSGYVLFRFMIKPLDGSFRQKRSCVCTTFTVIGGSFLLFMMATIWTFASGYTCAEEQKKTLTRFIVVPDVGRAVIAVLLVPTLGWNGFVCVFWQIMRRRIGLRASSAWNRVMIFHTYFAASYAFTFFVVIGSVAVDGPCIEGGLGETFCRVYGEVTRVTLGWSSAVVGLLFLFHPVMRHALYNILCIGRGGRPGRRPETEAGEDMFMPLTTTRKDSSGPLPLSEGAAGEDMGGFGFGLRASPSMNLLFHNELNLVRKEILKIRHDIIFFALKAMARTLERLGSEIKEDGEEVHFQMKDRAGRGYSTLIIVHNPVEFCALRAILGVNKADVAQSLRDSLHDINPVSLAGGKSGQFCFLTADQQYVIKTIIKSEVTVLLRLVEGYLAYLDRHRQSLLARFIGLYSLTIGMEHMYFLVMDNVTHIAPEGLAGRFNRFDLKGSLLGRYTHNANPDNFHLHTHKDGDFVKRKRGFMLGAADTADFVALVDSDSSFLESQGLVDYSLLVNVYDRADNPEPVWAKLLALHAAADRKFDGPRRMWKSAAGDQVMVMGVIDYLQLWNLEKKAEYIGKSVLRPVTGKGSMSLISAVNARHYGLRFRRFCARISGDSEAVCALEAELDVVLVASGDPLDSTN